MNHRWHCEIIIIFHVYPVGVLVETQHTAATTDAMSAVTALNKYFLALFDSLTVQRQTENMGRENMWHSI